MECGRVLIDLAACGRWFWGTWRRRLCLCGIASEGKGGGLKYRRSFFWEPSYQTPSPYVFPLTWQTKFHTNMKEPPKIAVHFNIVLLLSTALQLLVQSFGLLNHFFPSSSILDQGLPIWQFQPLYIILPAYLWSSCWPLWNEFPGVYCFDHSCLLHYFDTTIPS